MAAQAVNSPDPNVAAVSGENTGAGIGVSGKASSNFGVAGFSVSSHGVHGESTTNHAVHGESIQGRGVVGISQTFVGVTGESTSNDGVFGTSQTGIGVRGTCTGNNFGVAGFSDIAHGVHGESRTNHAVHGESPEGRGVIGISQSFIGTTGQSTTNDGVLGISTSGIGVHGKGGKLAGFFEGDVVVTGDIRLGNADCAEDFDVAGRELADLGTVMVLNESGELVASTRPFDKRVAGVISGAGDYKPGIVLDRRENEPGRQPIGLVGKVYCKVDAQFGPILAGDLLTTSPTTGHAMATHDPIQSFGAVIGKALRPQPSGQGLIPILIALQ